MCFNIDLPSWRLVLELFLREDVSHCKALLLRTFLGFDLRLVRLVLVSVFRFLLVLPVNFRLVRLSQSRCSFRFSSLVFLAICCTKVTTRPTGFTRLRLCLGVVLTLVTSVVIEASSISAAIDTPRMFCVCVMLLFVTSSEFFTVRTLFFISATCFSSTCVNLG